MKIGFQTAWTISRKLFDQSDGNSVLEKFKIPENNLGQLTGKTDRSIVSNFNLLSRFMYGIIFANLINLSTAIYLNICSYKK